MYFWSESHLKEKRNYGNLKIMIREFIRKIIYKRFNGFWYAGQLSKQFIESYCGTGKEMCFVPNLIEEVKYEEASRITKIEKDKLKLKYGIKNNKVIFICPARLSYVKGIDKFISIFAKCSKRNEAIILVAGEGEMREIIEKQVKELKLDVQLLGFRDQESIIDLYSISDVFLLPSLSDPNPLTCIEALWSGLPLLISEHCGNYPEIVKQGKNGYVFSYKEENKLIEYLDLLITASDDWKIKASQTSKKIAEEKYLSRLVVKRLINYYHSLGEK